MNEPEAATPKYACIILAAGKGTRMCSNLPKVMHKLAHKPLIVHVLEAVAELAPEKVITVVAPGMDSVREAALAAYPACGFAEQKEQKGTGHAAMCAEAALKKFDGVVLIVFGDTPLITPDTLKHLAHEAVVGDMAVLGFHPEDPTGYGRLVLQGGVLARIIEHRDASEMEKEITLCNAGVMAVQARHLFSLLHGLGANNLAGEYYLTDIVAEAASMGHACRVVEADAQEVMGINTRAQLAEAEHIIQQRLRARAMENGATLIAPETVFFAADTQLGRDVVVQPHVVFGPGVRVESGTEIRAFSHIEGAHVGANAVVGPFARLRPGAKLAEEVHIGNFVEVKASEVARGAKINHLSYVGDASVGEAANVGAGTITCNYDGVKKHRTEIGAGAFIGSNSSLVAPVSIGAHAKVGAGSVITEDVPDGALALERAVQVVKKRK